MLKMVLSVLGWLFIAWSILNISIRSFATIDMVIRFNEFARSVDEVIRDTAIGIILISLAKIISLLEERKGD